MITNRTGHNMGRIRNGGRLKLRITAEQLGLEAHCVLLAAEAFRRHE
jgi:hypothetical protein